MALAATQRSASPLAASWAARRKASARRLVRVDVPHRKGADFWLAVLHLLVFALLLQSFVEGEQEGHYLRYLVLQSWVLFVLIEMGHEAVHGAVHSSRRLNDAVGHVSCLLVGSTFKVHRRQHLSHHTHPMQDRDIEHTVTPELGDGLASFVVTSLTNVFAFSWMLRARSLRHRPEERRGLLVVLAGVFSLLIAFPVQTLLGWLAPLHIALAMFWFIAAWLPHGVLAICRSPRFPTLPHGLIQLLTYYHEEHHLRPAYPFYQWPELYFARRRVMEALPLEQRAFVTRELRLMPIDQASAPPLSAAPQPA